MTQTTDTDLVERLNARFAEWLGHSYVNPDGPEAAAEIKRLRDEVADRDAKLAVLLDALKNPPKHHYWRPAGARLPAGTEGLERGAAHDALQGVRRDQSQKQDLSQSHRRG
jgi:hypothetical protein